MGLVAWRLRILHRDGFVPGSGRVWKEKGHFKTEGRAYSTEDAVGKYAAAIGARLKSKIARGDDGRSILLVYINDEQLPPEGLPALLERARVAASGLPFAATFLVGSSDEKEICELLAGVLPGLGG